MQRQNKSKTTRWQDEAVTESGYIVTFDYETKAQNPPSSISAQARKNGDASPIFFSVNEFGNVTTTFPKGVTFDAAIVSEVIAEVEAIKASFEVEP